MGLFRIFLALVVAFDHWRVSRLSGDDTLSGLFGFDAGHAVLFFYMISGFLISYALTENYSDNHAGHLAFYRSRVIRIYSLYGPLALVSIVAFGWPVDGDALRAATRLSLFGQDWIVAFGKYPMPSDFSGNLIGLHQSWTLGAELAFYALAPILARRTAAIIIVLAASLAVRAAFVVVFGDAEAFPTWTYYFLPSTICFFMFGAIAHKASVRFPILLKPSVALCFPMIIVATPLLQAIVFKAGWDLSRFDGWPFWIPLLIAAASMPALFAATKDSPFLNYLGNLSYPIYLMHSFVLMLAGVAIAGALPEHRWTAALVFLAIATGVAAIVHEIVEKKVAAAMRRL